MNTDIFKLDKSLSIVELENRQELTIATAFETIEARKTSDDDYIRCKKH
jgi:hypothetical protein